MAQRSSAKFGGGGVHALPPPSPNAPILDGGQPDGPLPAPPHQNPHLLVPARLQLGPAPLPQLAELRLGHGGHPPHLFATRPPQLRLPALLHGTDFAPQALHKKSVEKRDGIADQDEKAPRTRTHWGCNPRPQNVDMFLSGVPPGLVRAPFGFVPKFQQQ